METVKRKCQVVMLPTRSGDSFPILQNINGRGNKLYTPTKEYYYTEAYLKETQFQPQHLYITSDDEIKKGDWGIYYPTFKIAKSSYNRKDNYMKKIIATTDTSLNLPQPSQLFIEKYITEYNKDNVIKRVDVEYEEVGTGCGAYPAKDVNYYTYPIPDSHNKTLIKKLKVNSNNEITVRKIKNSWSREEVVEIAAKYWYEGKKRTYERQNKKYISFEEWKLCTEAYKVIQENL